MTNKSEKAEKYKNIIEAALMVSGRPLSVGDLQKLFEDDAQDTKTLRGYLAQIKEKYQASGIELCELASGFQFQARAELSPWLSRLWEERAPRFTRAFLETAALIAYRQPITRAEIEEIRGVTVSSNIIKTLQEREWVRIVGYRDVPGKPALYATTKNFLDHLGLKSLNELPPLNELRDMDSQEQKLHIQLELTQAADGEREVTDEPEIEEPSTAESNASNGTE